MLRPLRVPACFLLALLFLAPSLRADVRETPGVVKVMSYNMENFFDVFDDPYTADEGTPPKMRDQIKLLAETIRKADPDVLAVVEVENEHVLRAMVREFLSDMGYQYIDVDQSNDLRGIKVGVISRLPILRTASYRHQQFKVEGRDRPMAMSRGLFQVTLDAGAKQPLQLFVVHLKSKRSAEGDPKSAHRRLAEATFVKSVIGQQLKANPDAWLALVGDLNDTPDSPPMHALLEDHELIDVHAGLPADQRITYLNEPYRSTIDYILVSPALDKRVVKDSANLVRDEAMLKGSDHAPVFVTFDLK